MNKIKNRRANRHANRYANRYTNSYRADLILILIVFAGSIGFGIPSTTYAMDTAVPESAASARTGSPELERLFYTPQERRLRDRKRFAATPVAPNPPEKSHTLVINGRIEREDGHTTTWVNGQGHDDIARDYIDSLPGDPATLSIGTRMGVRKNKKSRIAQIGDEIHSTSPATTLFESNDGISKKR